MNNKEFSPKEELDKVAERLHCKPEQVAMIIDDFLKHNYCSSGGGCAGNGLCCWYMPERD